MVVERKDKMDWNLDDSRPIWPQIKDKLMQDIIAGVYPMGSSFPTVRELAAEAQVNRNTMQRALSDLETEGLVITNRTAGRVVTTDQKLIELKKLELARANIHNFLDMMESLGYDAEATIKLMKEER